MTIEDLIRYFTEASISGASKTQVTRRFKELYNLALNEKSKVVDEAALFINNNIKVKSYFSVHLCLVRYKSKNFLYIK